MSGCFCRDRVKPRRAGSRATVALAGWGKRSLSPFALVLSFAIAPSVLADTIVWGGGAGGNWFIPGNWISYGRVPLPDDNVTIDSAGPAIAAGTKPEIYRLSVGPNTDGTMSVNGDLSTFYTDLGAQPDVTGTLRFFSGGKWQNEHDISVGKNGRGELVLSGSSAKSGGNIYVAEKETANGLFVLDNSSSLENSGTVFVGYGASALPFGGGSLGVLEVRGASRLDTGALVVAKEAGSMGTVSVEGQGSSLAVSGDMVVGGGGAASFTIAGGGTVASRGDTIIADLQSSSISGFTIGGAGSSLKTEGTLVVGNEGNLTMLVGTAATVTSGAAIIGRRSAAVVVVADGDTKWTTGHLQIGGKTLDTTGSGASGALQIKTGGTVESAAARLGNVAGATGEVTVDGSGSVWTVGNGGLDVGLDGRGSLTVANGGIVNAADTVIARNAGSSGSIAVSGSESAFNAGDLYVGDVGGGSLRVHTGGAVTSESGYVATRTGSSSSVTVDGGGSTWTVAKALVVGYESGTEGDVSVSAGAGIRAGQIRLGYLAGSFGIMTVDGDDSNVSVRVDNNLAYSGYMDIGYDGDGSVSVFNGASLDAYRLYAGTRAGSSGTLYVNGTGSHVEISDTLVIGYDGGGKVDVTGGASLAATIIDIAFQAGSTGVLNIGGAAGQSAYSAGEIRAGAIVFGAGDGRIVFNHSETNYVLSADISGTGHIRAENGVTTLSGHNSYSGGTIVSGGTLKGTATSFGSGEIANNAELVVDGAGTLSNLVSGSGSFEKTGNGNLVLTGDSSYSGGTTVSAGTLTGTAKSFGPGEIVNNAQLVLDGAGTLSNIVSGTGALEKTGGGNLVLTGNSTYIGVTEVSSGKLSVNGSLASPVSVGSGATLGGSGTIGGLTVASGGALSPGNSIGTLTSTGDVRFLSGARYAVEIDADGNSDRLAVNGAVTIDSDVSLVVTPLSSHSAYSLGTQYTILTATNGISGAFSGISERFAYLTVSVTKSTDNGAAYLSFTRASPEPGLFAGGASPESASAANAVEALGEASPLYEAAVFLQQGETQSAFSQLTGELHPSLAMALINRSRLTRDVILDRMRSAFDGIDARQILGRESQTIDEGSLAFWSSGFGSRGRLDGDSRGPSVDIRGGGGLFGVDGDWDNGWRTGLAAGFGRDTVRQGGLAATADVDSYYMAAYAGGSVGPASLRFGAIHAFHDIETRRAIAFSTLREELTTSYDASTTQVFAEAAWRFDADLTRIEPYANIGYVQTHTGAFSEKNGVAAVSSGSASHNQLYSTLGARVSRDISVEGVNGRATFDLGWRHAYGDPAVESILSYQGGSAFAVASAAMTRDAAILNLGLSYDLNSSATLTFRYGAVFAADVLDQTAVAELGVRF